MRYNQEIGGNNFLSNSVLDEVNNIDRFVANNNKAKNNQNTIQADYTQDLKKNQKFDIGVKAILRTASSEFKSLIKFNEADKYEFNPSNSDYFKFYQTVYSMYGTYSFKVKSISIRSGYRIEHTATNGNFAASMMKVERSYVNLLPNVQISFKVLPAVTLLLNYNKRIQRPFIWNLNPFVNNNDTFNISSGNPTLNPQAIHNFSAQTKIFKGQSFAALALMISYSNNLIIQYSVFEPAIGRINTIPDNIGKEFQMSLNGTLSTKINQDWNVFFNGNIRYNRIRNKFFPEQVNHGIGGNGTMNSTYSIFKNFQLSSYAGFWKSPVTIQNQQNISYWYGIGIGYKMLGEKLSVSIDVANFLKQKVSNYSITEDPSFNMKTINITPFRSIGLSISWNFGKLSGNTSKKRGVNNDDIIANQQPNN
ncbi:MAG: outer membrane beta-barrel family protein [Chitinophagaceae bacterium]